MRYLSAPRCGLERVRPRQFRFLLDPTFLASLSLYFINKLWLRPNFECLLWHGYLNDLLCIPIFLPVSLFVQRMLRVRSQIPPTPFEIVLHTAVWSVLFEVIGPRHYPSVADPWDIVAYATGGIVAGVLWTCGTSRSHGSLLGEDQDELP